MNGKSELTDKDTMLPYVGKVIFKLLGDNYSLLYQEEEFSQGMFAKHNAFYIVFLLYPIFKKKVEALKKSNNISLA